MIYLDYCATAPTCDEALKAFHVASKEIGNANSAHTLGIINKQNLDNYINKLKRLLNVENKELIITSGATEANNLSLIGIFEKYGSSNKHQIITTEIEHASIISTCSKLMRIGAEILFAPLNNDGTVNKEALLELINENTLLVSIGAVNSEIGTIQPINELSNAIKEKNPEVIFHSDITQAIGKCKLDLSNIDLASFSAHKFYAPVGVGGLFRNKKIKLMPQVIGGDSVSIYRSGTPAYPLIASMAAALEYTLSNIDQKLEYIKGLNSYLRNKLNEINGVVINSPIDSVSNILNFSINGYDANKVQEFLSKKEIYVSTRSACSSNNEYSRIIDTLFHDIERAKSSIRVSLSFLTKKEELDILINELNVFIKAKEID